MNKYLTDTERVCKIQSLICFKCSAVKNKEVDAPVCCFASVKFEWRTSSLTNELVTTKVERNSVKLFQLLALHVQCCTVDNRESVFGNQRQENTRKVASWSR